MKLQTNYKNFKIQRVGLAAKNYSNTVKINRQIKKDNKNRPYASPPTH